MLDCVTQADFGSAEYLGGVFQRARRERVPICGAFDLTHRCNLRCVHCYVGHVTDQTRSESGELTTGQVVELLGAAADAGCLMMLLSGGEPLMRKDFIDIYEAAKRLGLVLTIFTNASLVTEEHVRAFEEFPPHLVEVSCYGVSETTYERVTGIPGAFGRVRTGVELLVERGIPLALKTMILRDNLEEIPAIEAWARDLGIRFRSDPLVVPRMDGDPTPLRQRVDPEIAVAVEFASPKRREQAREFIRRHARLSEEEGQKSDRLYQCGAGIGSFYLDPLGYMQPCLMSQSIKYNPTEMGFGNAWKAITEEIDVASLEGKGGCGDCPNILLCGYCPGLFELENATVEEPPEYVCRLGRIRHDIIGLKRGEVVNARTD